MNFAVKMAVKLRFKTFYLTKLTLLLLRGIYGMISSNFKLNLMPIIPFLGYDKMYVAEAALATDKEFEEFLKNRTMPKAYIPTEFLQEYFEKNNQVADLSKIVRDEDKATIELLYPAHLTLDKVNILLKEVGLDYNDFVYHYAFYLKKL